MRLAIVAQHPFRLSLAFFFIYGGVKSLQSLSVDYGLVPGDVFVWTEPYLAAEIVRAIIASLYVAVGIGIGARIVYRWALAVGVCLSLLMLLSFGFTEAAIRQLIVVAALFFLYTHRF